MKNINILLAIILCFSLPNISQAVVHVSTPAEATTTDSWMSDLSFEEFFALSPKDLKAKTGKRVKIADRVALRTAQWQARKAMKKGNSLNYTSAYDDAVSNFNILGFLLGFFLLLIGVLLALLLGEGGVKSALIGMLCAILVGLIGFAIF